MLNKLGFLRHLKTQIDKLTAQKKTTFYRKTRGSEVSSCFLKPFICRNPTSSIHLTTLLFLAMPVGLGKLRSMNERPMVTSRGTTRPNFPFILHHNPSILSGPHKKRKLAKMLFWQLKKLVSYLHFYGEILVFFLLIFGICP